MQTISDMNPILFTLPIISALIGWATNFVAVKMLFKPHEPKGFGWFTVQGLIPKRHAAIAEAVSQAVEKEFLTKTDLKELIQKVNIKELMAGFVRKRWDEKSEEIMDANPMIKMFVPSEKLLEIRDKVVNGFTEDLEADADFLAQQISDRSDIGALIHRNIMNFDYTRLEEIIESLAKNEFRYIERLGGILGFLIGMVQLLIVLLLQ
jgi:uncharacterized membrane protein YheB (UPF0754 family)